jgi:hypothetical protein
MAVEWLYSLEKHQYVNAKTGRKLTPKQLTKIRDSFIKVREDSARALAERLASGEITQAAFEDAFRASVAETFAAQQALGAGGFENLAKLPGEVQQLETMLTKQIPFADQFMQDMKAGLLSNDEIAQRAALYQGSSVEAFEKANASDAGVGDLPYWPGDWGTVCKAGCRCSWEIETVFEGEDEVTYVTWQTEEDGAVCEDCQQRGNDNQHREVSRVPRTDPGPHGLEQAA